LKSLIYIVVFYCSSILCLSQTAYQHISDRLLYGFLDELASIHVIDINSGTKPYSRMKIAFWLIEADAVREWLSHAQTAKLDMYLREFALERNELKSGNARLLGVDSTLSVHLLTPEVVWRDSLFKAVLRPVYGLRRFKGLQEKFLHTYGGVEAIAYIGSKWSVYVSLTDNWQSLEPLALPTYLTHEQGGSYKIGVQGRTSVDFSEMKGGLSYDFGWGSIGLLKDHFEWGDNHNGSNILSGRTPSFASIKLHMNPVKWLEFDYFHGWLASQVIDSTRSYYLESGRFKGIYREKYIAANLYTFKPLPRLNISLGNAIIYSDVNLHPGYMIPFFFFKSIAHTTNMGVLNHNSMMFMNISSRQIKHLHIYCSWYSDEFAIVRVGNPDRHNFHSYKGGFSITGWPLKDIFLTGETTFTKPMTYQHQTASSTFETNNFNLGHYLRDNARDYHAAVRYSPLGTLQVTASYLYAWKGNLYDYVYGFPEDTNPVLKDKTWSNKTLSFQAEMLLIPNLRIFSEYTNTNIRGYDVDGITALEYLNKFTPRYLQGKKNILKVGFNLGF
jgi:hypothetical protein